MKEDFKTIMSTVDFSKSPDLLIPAIVQDTYTQKVLMQGFMNADALRETIETGKVTFFSRSKNRLWTKGESSGNFLLLHDIQTDCDKDSLLIQALPSGPVCHTGSDTCFGTININPYFLLQLENIIADRIDHSSAQSYTSALFKKGINKVAQKVGEEAVELIIEAKDNNQELFLNEAADLLYHFLILLKSKGQSLSDVEQILRNRHDNRKISIL